MSSCEVNCCCCFSRVLPFSDFFVNFVAILLRKFSQCSSYPCLKGPPTTVGLDSSVGLELEGLVMPWEDLDAWLVERGRP